MFSKSGELYDRIYGAFKDYAQEAASISQLIRGIQPTAKSVLDIGCGTGEHAHHLSSKHGYIVDGIDLDPILIRLAQAKNPHGVFSVADMASFDLGKTYDVVMCLFSSIGYLKTLLNVEKALIQFGKHLNPHGVVIVEPWFTPEGWTEGRVYLNTYEDETLKVSRMSHSKKEGQISVLSFHYLIGTEEGVSHEVEKHELGLFTVGEMTQCFQAAGFTVKHDPKGLTDRGLYIATKK